MKKKRRNYNLPRISASRKVSFSAVPALLVAHPPKGKDTLMNEVDSRPHSETVLKKRIEYLKLQEKKLEQDKIKKQKKECKARIPGLKKIDTLVPPGMSKPEFLARLIHQGLKQSLDAQGKKPPEEMVSFFFPNLI
jgi:hypothetical protein